MWSRVYWLLILVAGVGLFAEWRGCLIGMEMHLFDTHYACRGGERVVVPLDYDAVGIEK